MSVLRTIQENLQTLYQIRLEEDVENFLTQSGGEGPETLWIRQENGELQIALFIDPALLDELKKKNPFRQITRRNLNAFLIAIEGVSHFVYFLKKAAAKKPVSLLELELQAEVDKYLLSLFCFLRQNGKIPPFLFAVLFENVRFRSVRYQTANRLAVKFCAWLDRNFLHQRRWRQAIARARDFYSLDHWAKIAQLTP